RIPDRRRFRWRSDKGGHLECERGGLSGQAWSAGDLQNLTLEPLRAGPVGIRMPHTRPLTRLGVTVPNVRICRFPGPPGLRPPPSTRIPPPDARRSNPVRSADHRAEGATPEGVAPVLSEPDPPHRPAGAWR